MKTVTTKIPNKEKKAHYALIHKDTYEAIEEYLKELPYWIEDGEIEDWISEVYNELEGLRRI